MTMEEQRLQLCLIGGTFDRFHIGHEVLLSAALRHAEKIEVWLASDEMAGRKSAMIEDWATRSAAVQVWLDRTAEGRGSIHLLEDEFGPARECEDTDSIACTEETKIGCTRINEARADLGLAPLEIISVPHVFDALGGIVSSTRIRSGLIDREGGVWVPERAYESTLQMPSELDAEFKIPLGDLYEGPEQHPDIAMSSALESIADSTPVLIAVGDVTVNTLLGMDTIPDVALADGMTKRQKLPDEECVDPASFDRVIEVINPAGVLTPDLLLACREAISSDLSTLVMVQGEEDLAPVFLHLIAPLGTALLYGQPGKGVVLRVTDEEIKQRSRALLDAFEVA